jgi:hypothetical protein
VQNTKKFNLRFLAMATNTIEQDKQLATLKTATRKVLLQIRQTNKQEREHLAAIYVWWCSVKDVDGYLTDLYAKNCIEYYNLKNKINFRPLLTYLTNGEIGIENLNYWQQTLRAIDVEYHTNPKHYSKDSIVRIAQFLDMNGGKTGLAGYHNKVDVDEIEDGELKREDVERLAYSLDEANLFPTLLWEAKAFYEQCSTLQTAALPALNTTQDGYSVVVVKRDGTQAKLLGTANEQSFIDAMLATTYRKNFEALPPTMRCVLEPLHLLNVPLAIAYNIDKYIDHAEGRAHQKDLHSMRDKRRLIYRKGTADFLISSATKQLGVVLTAKPKHKLFPNLAGDIYMNNNLRLSVEVRLLHQTMFNMFTTQHVKQYVPVPKGFLHAYRLPIETKQPMADEKTGEFFDAATAALIKRHTHNITHPSLSWTPFYKSAAPVSKNNSASAQADLLDAPFKAKWQGVANIDWLRNVVSEFFDGWIVKYAAKAERDINMAMHLKLTNKSISVGYEFGKKGYDNYKPFELASAKGGLELQVRTADFAFVLRQLADLDVQGDISIQANSDGVLLHFETSANNYTCLIPACTVKGVRYAALMQQYTPSQTVLNVQQSKDPDDEYMDDATAEKQKAELLRKYKKAGWL